MDLPLKKKCADGYRQTVNLPFQKNKRELLLYKVQQKIK